MQFYCFGNGTTIYKGKNQIGHISEHGHVRLDGDVKITDDEMERINSLAAKHKDEFMQMWNKFDDINKWRYMLEIPTVGCGFSKVGIVQWDNRNLTITEQVKLMEPVFFEMHM